MSEATAKTIATACFGAIIGVLVMAAIGSAYTLHPPNVIERGWFSHDGAVYRVVPAEVR